MSTRFRNFSEYVAYNDRFRLFKAKTPAQKRSDWQAYLLRQKRKAINARVVEDSTNRSLIPTPPPPPRQKNRVPRQVGLKIQNSSTVLSECLLLYAQASIDPFTKLAKNPCIPDNLCAPSFKFQSKIECDMAVGANKTGFVAFSPWAMAFNDPGIVAPYVDAAIAVTTPTYTDTGITLDASEVTFSRVNIFNSNSPFSVANYGALPMRLVAAGVEIMYTGELLNQSGAITVLQNDGLNGYTNATPISFVRQNPRAMTCANSKDNRCYISYYPTDQKYLSYAPLTDYFASVIGSPVNNHHPLLIAISGGTAGITFMVKAVAYFEAQIPNFSATPSDSDPIGYPAFSAARTQMLPSPSPQIDLKNTLVNTLKNMGRSISGLGGAVGGAIGTALGNPAAGSVIGSAAGNLLSSILGD